MDYLNDAEVEVKDVIYERNANGFADVMHGKFTVHFDRDHKETELIMTIFKCAKGSVGMCKDNPTEYIEDLSCERFQTDKTGPWYIFSPAMDKRNLCAELAGEFELNGAKFEAQYLEKYMTIEEGHYRIKALYHLPHETMDIRNLRGCIEVDFDIIA